MSTAYEFVEFDHYPEVVENGQGTYRLELLGIKEELRDPHDRREFFAGLSDDDFTHMLGYINSLTMGERQISYEYEDGGHAAFETPPLQDKEPLMKLTFQTVRDILTDNTFDDRAALRRAGLAMAGACGFVHPKQQGNGRMARSSHYLIEFGTERGDQAFNEEMYAIIGNIRVYEGEPLSLYDTPSAPLRRALDKEVIRQSEAAGATPPQGSKLATARVEIFLDMMRGTKHIPIEEDIVHSNGLNPDRTSKRVEIPAGTYDGAGLYEAEYLRLSAIPNRSPEDVPAGARRVMAAKPERAPEMVDYGAEFIE